MLSHGRHMFSLHNKLQTAVERLFFRGKSTRKSEFVAFVFGNIILMLFLFFVILNNIAYDWTGQLYPVGSGFQLGSVFGGLDAAIWFIPEMVIFYVYLFYGFVVLTMLYFGFVEYKRGYALGWSLVIINAVAVLVYIVFPVSTYTYRQQLLAHPIVGNFWANQVYSVFANDTSFNCFPSLHAAVSTICLYTWFRYSQIKPSITTKATTLGAFVVATGVILSTLFIKQHYIVDEISGVALALVVGRLTFKNFWKRVDTLKEA
jgi:membrane-associated phospholipid phosphatase